MNRDDFLLMITGCLTKAAADRRDERLKAQQRKTAQALRTYAEERYKILLRDPVCQQTIRRTIHQLVRTNPLRLALLHGCSFEFATDQLDREVLPF